VWVVVIIVEFIIVADDRFDSLAVGGSGATEDCIRPVALDLEEELLTLAEDRGSIDLVVGRIEINRGGGV
jgi:hypothetical protein